jgi:nitrite reductase/ring-hydroxylating ferredoxin subunit
MFYPLEKLHLLHDGYKRTFKVGRTEIMLIQDEGRTYLIENRCPHAGAPLTHGPVFDGRIGCPMHGLTFDLATGHSGACAPLNTFVPVYEGTMIGVDL